MGPTTFLYYSLFIDRFTLPYILGFYKATKKVKKFLKKHLHFKNECAIMTKLSGATPDMRP
jgi:hypothetical protein